MIRLLFNFTLIFAMASLSAQSAYFGLVVAWSLYSTQFHFWGYAGLGHELLHQRVFKSKKVNNILYYFCSALTWSNGEMFRDTHMLHHRETFSERDVEAKSVQDWRYIAIIQYCFIDLNAMCRKIFYIVINSFGFYPNLSRLDALYCFAARITLSVNVVIYTMSYFLVKDILVTTLLFLSPFSFSLLNKILAKAQHHGLEHNSKKNALEFSRTLKLPRILSFIYANMNFHAEHHLTPSIPYYNLPQLHSILARKKLVSSQAFWPFIKKEIPFIIRGGLEKS